VKVAFHPRRIFAQIGRFGCCGLEGLHPAALPSKSYSFPWKVVIDTELLGRGFASLGSNRNIANGNACHIGAV
jgi:hypothetical protein